MTSNLPASAPSARSRRSSPKSVVLFALSVTPLAALAVAFASIAVDVLVAVRSFSADTPGSDAVGVAIGGSVFVGLLVLAAVASVAALLVLLVDVFSNPAVPREDRVVWLVCLLFASAFAFPAYWYAIWWRGGREPDATDQPRRVSAPSSRSIERSS